MKDYPDQFERRYKVSGQARLFRGVSWFALTPECKAAAKHVRDHYRINCRATRVSGTTGLGLGYVGGRLEGPLLFLPDYNRTWKDYEDATYWDRVQEAYEWVQALPGDGMGKRYRKEEHDES